jgi:hypothetical protein
MPAGEARRSFNASTTTGRLSGWFHVDVHGGTASFRRQVTARKRGQHKNPIVVKRRADEPTAYGITLPPFLTVNLKKPDITRPEAIKNTAPTSFQSQPAGPRVSGSLSKLSIAHAPLFCRRKHCEHVVWRAMLYA